MIKAGIDWGSSAFRAYRFNEQGDVTDSVVASCGLREIEPATAFQFEKILFDNIGQWLSHGDSVLLSGMITSRAGWIETDYLACPQDVTRIAAHAKRHHAKGCELLFLPGIKQDAPVADVMRGEELQLLGASNAQGSCTVVLPGTHSKWAIMDGTTLSQFRTVMTGELFELIRHQSLVGAIASTNTYDQEYFLQGVRQGYESDTILSDIFSLRSSVLLKQYSECSIHSRLSGMLIGREIREGQQLMGSNLGPVVLVGAESLCSMYQTAFESIGRQVVLYEGEAAVAGFRKVAKSILSTGTPQ